VSPPLSLPPFNFFAILPLTRSRHVRLGAATLSHHVDDFALVSAFFLFSIGCLNIFLGLIFREKAKAKRSVTSWRDHAKSVLPPPVRRAASSASTLYGGGLSEKKGLGRLSARFAGYGFGRQGEKEADVLDVVRGHCTLCRIDYIQGS